MWYEVLYMMKENNTAKVRERLIVMIMKKDLAKIDERCLSFCRNYQNAHEIC